MARLETVAVTSASRAAPHRLDAVRPATDQRPRSRSLPTLGAEDRWTYADPGRQGGRTPIQDGKAWRRRSATGASASTPGIGEALEPRPEVDGMCGAPAGHGSLVPAVALDGGALCIWREPCALEFAGTGLHAVRTTRVSAALVDCTCSLFLGPRARAKLAVQAMWSTWCEE